MKIELLDVLGDDLMVVNAARVSMAKERYEFDMESDSKLISYLAEHEHWTPFGHPQIQFRVTVPIFVARQWTRSVIGTVRNEISRRYVDKEPAIFIPESWRARPEGSIKQGSGSDVDTHTQFKAENLYREAVKVCLTAYDTLLHWGIAPEQARMILPQSMYTQWIETGSLAYWARFYKLRSDPHAQQEIQACADMVDAAIKPLFPVSWEALTT